MSRVLVVGLFLLAAVIVFGVSETATIHGQPGATPQAVSACGCPKTVPVCCRDCNGNFASCARSYAFCPECAAP